MKISAKAWLLTTDLLRKQRRGEAPQNTHNGRCLLVMFATSLLPARNKNARCLYCGVILCISARTLRLIDICVWLKDHAIEISVIDCMLLRGNYSPLRGRFSVTEKQVSAH